MTPARTVTYDGVTYKVRGKVEIPDLTTMKRFDALTWLVHHTYPKKLQPTKSAWHGKENRP